MRLALEAHMRFLEKRNARILEAFRGCVEFSLGQPRAVVRHGDIFRIHLAVNVPGVITGDMMQRELAAVEIDMDRGFGATALLEAEDVLVEMSRLSKVPAAHRQMERV